MSDATLPGFWVPCLESDCADAWRSDWHQAPAMIIRTVVFWLLKTGRHFNQRRIMLWAGRSAPYVRPIIASAREMFAAWSAKTGSAQTAHTPRTSRAHSEPVTVDNTEEVAHTSRTLRAHPVSPAVSTSRARETGNRQQTTEDLPACPAGQRIDHLSRADTIWPELVRDLQAAGYRTLEQLAEDGRDSVAAALGSGASRGRLDRLQTVLQRNGHDWATQGRRGSHGARETAANTNRPDRPAGRPDRAPVPEEVPLRWAPGTAPFDQPDIYLISEAK